MQRPLTELLSVFLAELLGTGMLLFFGCGGCLTWGAPASALQMAMTFGMTVMLIIQSFGAVSGAHLNPVVSVAAFVQRQIDARTTAVYIVAQMLGSFMGFGLLKVLTPEQHFGPPGDAEFGHCMTVPHADVSVLQALTMEFVATAVLVLICCSVSDPRNAHATDSIGLRFGFAVMALGLVAGPFSGGSLNPARSFAPALWHGNMFRQWIYWIGPLAAGILTPLLYQAVFWRDVIEAEQPPTQNGGCPGNSMTLKKRTELSVEDDV